MREIKYSDIANVAAWGWSALAALNAIRGMEARFALGAALFFCGVRLICKAIEEKKI